MVSIIHLECYSCRVDNGRCLCLCLFAAVGRDLMRPNVSSLIAAPTFPRTVPRTSTIQRQSRTSVADNALVDCSVRQRQPSQPLIDGPRSQTGSRQTQQNAVDTDRDRSVFITDVQMCILLFVGFTCSEYGTARGRGGGQGGAGGQARGMKCRSEYI